MIRSFIVLALVLSAALSNAQEAQTPAHNYQCIADSLQAYNSSIFYDMTQEDIDKILNDENSVFHDQVVEVARKCDSK